MLQAVSERLHIAEEQLSFISGLWGIQLTGPSQIRLFAKVYSRVAGQDSGDGPARCGLGGTLFGCGSATKSR